MIISIVIPFFDAEKYLARCLDSVLAALGAYEGEIILVDSNSHDRSLKIARDYQSRHPKMIHIMKCPTWGAAAARNFGATKARGQYIWFVDADDFIAKPAISKLAQKVAKSQPDLIMFGAERIYQNGHRDYLSPVSPREANYKSRFVRYGMGPWQLIIRRKWWQAHAFKFQEGIIHEDMELMSALILDTDKLDSINQPLYYYVQTPESVLHKKEFSPHVFDIFPALEGLYERFKLKKAISEYYPELEWFFIWNLLIDSAKDFSKFKEARSGFKRSRKMIKKYFPKWYRNRFLLEKPLKLKLRVYLNYFKVG